MRKNIVAGNWKMNKTLQEGIALAKELNETLANEKPNCDVIICAISNSFAGKLYVNPMSTLCDGTSFIAFNVTKKLL